MKSIFSVCVAMVLASCASSMAAGPDKSDVLENALRTEIERVKLRMDSAQPRPPEIRNLTQYALNVLADGGDPAKAEGAIRRMMTQQIMDTNAKRYGDVPWQEQHPEISDPNSIEFTMSPLATLLNGPWREKLSPELLSDLTPHLKAGLAAIRRHKVSPDYTNIYLIKICNLLLLGQYLQDRDAIAEADQALDAALTDFRARGVGEYLSGTYTSVQITSAVTTALFCNDATIKRKLTAILDLLYADVLASYFPAAQNLAGPESRSYYFVPGGGSIETIYFMSGLRSQRPMPDVGYYIAMQAGGYRPSEELLALAKTRERVYKSRWSLEPGKDRYLYMTPDFAIGSSSAFYQPQDRQIAIRVGSQPDLPILQLVADVYDEPYGKVQHMDPDGHAKVRHLKNQTSTVQERGTVLALWDLVPDVGRYSTTSIATNFLFPLTMDEAFLDGRLITIPKAALTTDGLKAPGPKMEVPGTTLPTLGLRYGRAGVVVRYFRVDSLQGESQSVIRNDGNAWGVGRLAAYHYRGAEQKFKTPHLRVGVLIVTDTCAIHEDFTRLIDRVNSAEIVQTADDTQWQVTAQIGDLKLESVLDGQTGTTAGRKVNGKPYVPEVSSLNGVNLIEKYLGSTPKGPVSR